MSQPEQTLHIQFCKYGANYLEQCRLANEPADPKIYETIYKYLDSAEIETVSVPDEGSLAEKEMEKLKQQMEE